MNALELQLLELNALLIKEKSSRFPFTESIQEIEIHNSISDDDNINISTTISANGPIGPQGPPGPKGEQGPVGPPGPKCECQCKCVKADPMVELILSSSQFNLPTEKIKSVKKSNTNKKD